MVDIASLVRQAKLPERTMMICLRADLVHIHEDLSDKLTVAKRAQAKADTLAAPLDVPELTEQIREVEEEMRAATVPFLLRALPRPRFRALVADHPPRKGDDGNVLSEDWNGVNRATYYDALIRACTVSPEMDEETWRLLLEEKLSDRQYEDLAEAAFDISRDKIDYPFMYGASQPTPNFDSVSKPPKNSASRSNGSTAGSPPRSLSTSTARTASSSGR